MAKISTQSHIQTGIAALLHLLVDGLCICCLYLTTSDGSTMVTTYVTYNVLAFLTQPLTGMMADRMRQRHWMLLAAVVLLTLAVMAASYGQMLNGKWQMAVAVLLGMGNSLFHVWGGKQTAIKTDNDIRDLGVFVSTGAFGLAIGAVFASWALLYIFLLGIGILAMLTQTSQTLSPTLPRNGEGDHAACSQKENNPHGLPIEGEMPSGQRGSFFCFFLLLIMLIVAARSYVGEAFSTHITRTTSFILLMGAVSMLGKMAGGWLVKGLGMWTAVLIMVLGAATCYLGRELHTAVMLLGLFLVNCTMPVTLYWANVMLKGKEGLAFGLLAAALIPGYLLALR